MGWSYPIFEKGEKMRYEIKDQEKSVEPTLKLSFDQRFGDTAMICGEDNKGVNWTLLELKPDGTFRRAMCLPDNIGLQVDKKGRIVESK